MGRGKNMKAGHRRWYAVIGIVNMPIRVAARISRNRRRLLYDVILSGMPYRIKAPYHLWIDGAHRCEQCDPRLRTLPGIPHPLRSSHAPLGIRNGHDG